MKKLLFITNIPAPYRIDFFNALGEQYDLTVIFEARRAEGIRFNWNEKDIRSFRAIFLNDGMIQEKRVDRQIFQFLRPGLYDHVIATSYGYYTEMFALIDLILKGIPYYLELDGGVIRPGENPFKAGLKRRIIRSAKGILSSSRITDRVMLHYGAKPGKIHRYPFSSLAEADILTQPPSDAEKRLIRTSLAIPEEHVILGVGQFIHRKGFDLLLKIAPHLPKNIGIYLAGAEPTQEYLKLSEGLTNVHYLGFLSKAPLYKIMQAADLFVLPTREDMWGLVVNEALANALPVITTTGCIAGTELITSGVNGALIPVEDEAALEHSIRALLENAPMRAQMADAALGSIRDYTIQGMVCAHQRILDGEGAHG